MISQNINYPLERSIHLKLNFKFFIWVVLFSVGGQFIISFLTVFRVIKFFHEMLGIFKFKNDKMLSEDAETKSSLKCPVGH